MEVEDKLIMLVYLSSSGSNGMSFHSRYPDFFRHVTTMCMIDPISNRLKKQLEV